MKGTQRIVFSKDLIERCRIVFERRARREISDEDVEIHLYKLGIIGLLAYESYSQSARKLEE